MKMVKIVNPKQQQLVLNLWDRKVRIIIPAKGSTEVSEEILGELTRLIEFHGLEVVDTAKEAAPIGEPIPDPVKEEVKPVVEIKPRTNKKKTDSSSVKIVKTGD
jgi:hypothetical protein